MSIHCGTCEMKSSCQKFGRCCRPQDSAHWAKEVEAAQPVFQAATQRLLGAISGLTAALKRESQQ